MAYPSFNNIALKDIFDILDSFWSFKTEIFSFWLQHGNRDYSSENEHPSS